LGWGEGRFTDAVKPGSKNKASFLMILLALNQDPIF
jgi:hypothetical protein